MLPSPVRAARAIAMLARYREARERSAGPPAPDRRVRRAATASPLHRLSGGRFPRLSRKRSSSGIGIAVTRDVLVRASTTSSTSTQLTPPLAVKIASPDIPHKTEVGGVKLNIRTREELDGGDRRGARERAHAGACTRASTA